MNNSKWEKALRDCDELEKILSEAPPVADPPTHARFRFLGSSLLGIGGGYMDDHVNKLLSRADMYFSARKHDKYDGGAMALKSYMQLSLLRAIRSEIKFKGGIN